MLEQGYAFSGELSRLNKGPQLTPRLMSLCKINAEQGALRFDQAQSWLGVLSPAAQKMKDAHLLSAERTRKILRPWIDQDLLQYKVFFVGQRGWIWLTAKGLKYFDVPLRYYEPTPASLAHLYAVNSIRLLLALRRPTDTWRSERLLRAEQHAQTNGQKNAHLPDAEVIGANGIVRAIECELTIKSEKRLEDIMFDLAANKRYHAIWYFLPEQVYNAVKACLKKLPTEHRKRFVLYTLEGEVYPS
jgi:hypothetical protein